MLATGARAHVPPMDGLEDARRDRRDRPRDADGLDRGRHPCPRASSRCATCGTPGRCTPPCAPAAGSSCSARASSGWRLALAAAEEGADVVAVHHGEIPMARNLDRGGGRTLALVADAWGWRSPRMPGRRASCCTIAAPPTRGSRRSSSRTADASTATCSCSPAA
ncbi:hypothetical protein [Clavibacter tessellarius]|uniref:hypothetical protein n=1 Tax=Clavibacter tessellarius TaxID=31965 RepID=UPI0032454FF6